MSPNGRSSNIWAVWVPSILLTFAWSLCQAAGDAHSDAALAIATVEACHAAFSGLVETNRIGGCQSGIPTHMTRVFRCHTEHEYVAILEDILMYSLGIKKSNFGQADATKGMGIQTSCFNHVRRHCSACRIPKRGLLDT